MNWVDPVNDSLYKYNTDNFCNIQDSKTDLRQYAKFQHFKVVAFSSKKLADYTKRHLKSQKKRKGKVKTILGNSIAVTIPLIYFFILGQMALFALALIKRLQNSAPPSHHGLYLFQNLDNLWTLQRVVVHVRPQNWLFSNMIADASGCQSLFKASNIHQKSSE